jgi:HEAT repeat protein
MRLVRLAVLALSLAAVASAWGADTPTGASSDELTVKAAHLGTTGPALLDFFHKRATMEPDPENIKAQVGRLADPSPDARERALADLVSLGAAAIPALRQAANNLDDLDAADRARQCLPLLEGPESANLARAAIRLLGERRPADAAAVLLTYLPLADDESVVQEVERILTVLTAGDTKFEPALRQALTDSSPIRRAVAASALAQLGGATQLAAVRPLLHDPKATVRLRTALALANQHDAAAVPVLIELLAELPPIQRKQAEEYLVALAGEWAVALPAGNDDVLRQLRRDVWAAWWKATDPAPLLAELRRRTLSDEDRDRALSLIGQLSNEDVAVREKATAGLIALGPAVAPLLHQAVTHENPRIGLFVGKCLQLVERDGPNTLPAAAVRLIALRKPEGSAAALLAYLPFAESPRIAEEVQSALAAVADGPAGVDPIFVQALKDRVAIRRAAAVEVLCKSALAEHRDAIRRLLNDADATVRLRTALALVARKDREAVPTLIALLADLPADQLWQAEDVLVRLAGERAPDAVAGSDPAARRKYRDAWAAWWRAQGSQVDLARLDSVSGELGYTLVLEQFDQNRRSNRILELDANGRVRWQIDGLQLVLDAQALPGDRLLLVEQGVARVSEREVHGRTRWQKQLLNAFACERLANGNTFVACRNQLVELDGNGREVLRRGRPQADIASARRLRDGQIVFVTYQGNYIRLDAQGKEVKNLWLPFLQNFVYVVTFLPNDHLLVPMYQNNKVVEYDLAGKEIWQATVSTPSSATRLSNGHTLVVSMGTQRVLELDRAGHTVLEYKQSSRPWKVRRR